MAGTTREERTETVIYLEALAGVLVAWALLGIATVAVYNIAKSIVMCRS